MRARASARAERVVDALAVATFTGMFLCVLVQVVLRYGFDRPLVWSDELARYLFVWCAFLGWIIAARRRSHLAITVVSDKLGPRGQAAFALVGAVGGVAFCAVLAWYGAADHAPQRRHRHRRAVLHVRRRVRDRPDRRGRGGAARARGRAQGAGALERDRGTAAMTTLMAAILAAWFVSLFLGPTLYARWDSPASRSCSCPASRAS